MNDLRSTNADRSKNLSATVLGAEWSFKYKGFSLTGEYFDRELEPRSDEADDSGTAY